MKTKQITKLVTDIISHAEKYELEDIRSIMSRVNVYDALTLGAELVNHPKYTEVVKERIELSRTRWRPGKYTKVI